MQDQGDQDAGRDPVPAMGQVVRRLTEINERLAAMTRVMETWDVIGQAKGILMERYGISSNEAHALLITASTKSDMRIALVAADLVSSGHLPDVGGP